jgi:hypothetical protein
MLWKVLDMQKHPAYTVVWSIVFFWGKILWLGDPKKLGQFNTNYIIIRNVEIFKGISVFQKYYLWRKNKNIWEYIISQNWIFKINSLFNKHMLK